eukprot:3700840-Rhodomonas_salina.2
MFVNSDPSVQILPYRIFLFVSNVTGPLGCGAMGWALEREMAEDNEGEVSIAIEDEYEVAEADPAAEVEALDKPAPSGKDVEDLELLSQKVGVATADSDLVPGSPIEDEKTKTKARAERFGVEYVEPKLVRQQHICVQGRCAGKLNSRQVSVVSAGVREWQSCCASKTRGRVGEVIFTMEELARYRELTGETVSSGRPLHPPLGRGKYLFFCYQT